MPLAPAKNESILRETPSGPGPGYYETSVETSYDRAKRRNRKNILVSSSERFDTDQKRSMQYIYGVGKKGSGPGPQDYDPVTSSLLKPSHNALMNPNLF